MKLVGFLLLATTSTAHGALTAAQKTALVDKHNALRAAVGSASHNQPCTAGDMQQVAWDDSLATGAQAWADACVGDHDPRAARDFGENLFMTLSGSDTSTKVLTDSVQGWYDEYKDTIWAKSGAAPVTKALKDCIDTDGDSCNIGHYFQVIWSKVSKIGCGVKSCASGLTVSGQSYKDGVLVVCRYDANPPGKDLRGQAPYLFGKKCAGCAGSCSTSPAGLCTKAPTRCVDKAISITIDKKYTNCADLVAFYNSGHATPWCTKLAKMMSAENDCPLTCKACSVPSGMGASQCGASTSGGSTAGTSGDSTSGTAGTSGGSTSSGSVATPTLLTGSMNMNVPNATAFLTDMKAQQAVKDGISDLLTGVSSSWIALVVTAARRLAGLVTIDEGRRLSSHGLGSVKVAYTITVPANSTTAASAHATNLEGLTKEALTTSIKTKLVAAKGASYNNMTVTSKTAVANSKSTTSTTGVKGTSGAVGMFIFGPAAFLVVAFLHRVI